MTLVPGAGMYRIVYHILYPEGEQAAYYFQSDITDGRNDRDCHVYC